MPEDALSPAEQDLARIAATSAFPDGFLSELIELAELELPTAIGLLINGMIMVGMVSAAGVMASEVDKQRALAANVARRQPSEGWSVNDAAREEQLREFETTSTTTYETERAAISAMTEEAAKYITEKGFDFAGAPAELSRRVIHFGAHRFLTLRDVQVVAPGQVGVIRLEVARVSLQQISAWWLIQVDEGGSASFPLWTTGAS